MSKTEHSLTFDKHTAEQTIFLMCHMRK